MEEIKLKEDQQKAYDILMSGENVFLTGAAGTGKTKLIEKYLNDMKESGKNIIVTATTGIAANILGGVTFHRAFGYNTDVITKDDKIAIEKISNNLTYADIIVIDEISMMRRDVFDLFCRQREIVLNRRQKAIDAGVEGINPNIQIIVIGDFTQLKPVYRASKNSNKKIKVVENGKEVEYLDKYYCQKYYENFNNGYCFSSKYWKGLKLKYVNLKQLIRTKDEKFVEIMNRLRKGDRSAIVELNNILKRTSNLSSDYITLCSTNDEAIKINSEFLGLLPSKEEPFDEIVTIHDESLKQKYIMYLKSKTNKDIKAEDPLGADRLGIEHLVLKVGARVMCLVNDTNLQYQNGSMGYVKEMNSKGVVVTLDNGNDVLVEPYVQKIFTYDSTKSSVNKVAIAEITQIPLKLAYAVTVHKSQGQTFDKVIIKPDKFFEEGHVIVAVSRCTSLEGMMLTSDLPLHVNKWGSIEDLPLVSYEVIEFYKNLEEGI